MVKPFLYAACDMKYFMKHGYAFYKSAVQHGHRVMVDITPDGVQLSNKEVKFFKEGFIKSFTPEELELAIQPRIMSGRYKLDVKEERAYHACVRFLNVDDVLRKVNNVLVLDIDSIIMSEIFVDDSKPLGLYLRPNEGYGMNVAAGAVFYKDLESTKDFILSTSEYINKHPVRWFIDQHALFHAYNECELEYTDLSKLNLMDWNFVTDTMVWTGKGNRKDTNQTYLGKKREIDATFFDSKTQT